jgi:hypothetical protein
MDGLLQARGQIVFLSALLISTAAVLYLESLGSLADTSHSAEIEREISEELGDVNQQLAGDGSPPRGSASLLIAYANAVHVGLVEATEAQTAVEPVIRDIESNPGSVTAELRSALLAIALAVPAIDRRIVPLLAPTD